ncbi:MAG: hypothetical protein QOF83_1822 [Solirubrobacteraceae bacterium]|nr:hypothetical protein [Solirubrobacteraceae bacterium]
MSKTARGLTLLALLILVLAGVSQMGGASSISGTATAITGTARTASTSPAPTTRYSLVHGCYRLRSGGQEVAASDGPFRMQAAALGTYLIYGVHNDFLGPALVPVSASGQSTLWQITGSARQGFEMVNAASGNAAAVRFVPAAGCAVYPEGQVDAVGPAFRGPSPTATVSGTIDAHTHVTAFEFLGGDFHCGRPWDAFGIPTALPDCAPYETGTNGQVESFIDYGQPAHPHDTQGWPTFRAWPSPTDLAEEGDYYTGIERAWKAGLRVMVTQLVDNEALCTLMTKRHNPCNDMQSVHIQAKDLRALQNYIDAQSGGPGTGFFRIVTSPFQARQVINSGKLAVVEGIEVSDLFNCGEYLGVPKCSQAQVSAGLKEVRGLGVSTFFPVHKFDNAFGGTKMDGGELGVLVNAGNHLETGEFWHIKTCTGPEHDSTQLTSLPVGGLSTILNGAAGQTLLPTLPAIPSGLHRRRAISAQGQLPVYPPPPHCNTRGLTSLGAYLIDNMIKQHFIVELDHMDALTADNTLSLLETHHYSGVISAHSWDSAPENTRIYNLGGFVTPIAGASPASFIAQWKAGLAVRNRRFYNGAGFGYGADMNGLAEESAPDTTSPIPYPFTSFDGKVTFTREQWGQRVFDLNKDGVANYGMFADWLQELSQLTNRAMVADMFHGAEAYLQMWERAYGVPATSCRPAAGRFTRAGLGALRLGASVPSLLYAAGQPTARPGRSYRYCVTGGGGQAAVFGARQHVAFVASRAAGTRAGRWHPGSRVRSRRLRRAARSLGGGLWLGHRLRNGTRFVYRLRGGRIAWVGAVNAHDAARVSRLRSDVRAAGLR